MDAIKQRILQFIDYKGLTNRNFCKQISVSPNTFSTKGALGSDILVKINIVFPELSMEWVVTNRRNMLFSEKESVVYDDNKHSVFSLNEPEANKKTSQRKVSHSIAGAYEERLSALERHLYALREFSFLHLHKLEEVALSDVRGDFESILAEAQGIPQKDIVASLRT